MAQEEDACFTFSDEDFERRYSAEEPAPQPSGPQQKEALAPRAARSRNRFMRTLLRRRLAASGRI